MSGQMPTGDPKIMPIPAQIAALRKEIADLRRQGPSEASRPPEKDSVVFSHPGRPMLAMPSPPYVYNRARGYLTRVVLAAREPGSGKTTVIIRKRSDEGWMVLAEVSLDSGDEYTVEDDFMSEVEDLDRITVDTTALGDGLLDLAVTVTFMESVE